MVVGHDYEFGWLEFSSVWMCRSTGTKVEPTCTRDAKEGNRFRKGNVCLELKTRRSSDEVIPVQIAAVLLVLDVSLFQNT